MIDRHEERQQRVDPRDARRKHDQTADDDGKGAERIAGNVKDGGTHVEVASRGPRQRQTDADVDAEAEARDRRHHGTVRKFGRRKPARGLQCDDRRDAEQQHAVDEGRDDLETREAVRLPIVSRPARLPRRDERYAQCKHVHENVRGIGQQREAVCDETAGEFEGSESRRERERSGQRRIAAPAARRRTLRVDAGDGKRLIDDRYAQFSAPGRAASRRT